MECRAEEEIMLQNATVMAVIPVSDLGRARTFYEKMLGLNP